MRMNMRLLVLVLLVSLGSHVLAKKERFTSTKAMQSKVPKALSEACKGNLDMARTLVKMENSAGALHIVSVMYLLLDADAESAAFVHDLAREKDPRMIPPLAQLYLNGETCNGLADIFYVSAVTIKRLKDSKVSHAVEFEAYTTMVTLLSDSGFPDLAEKHLQKAMTLEPDRAELRIRGALMIPGVYSSLQHIKDTRVLLEDRLEALSETEDFELEKLNEFAMSPTFYLIYQGFSDIGFLTELHEQYARGHPILHTYPSYQELPPFPPVHTPDKSDGEDVDLNSVAVEQPLRVGFVSSHFRRHSICKLFCGIIQDLASTTYTSLSGKKTSFQVYVFSGQDESREDKFTKKLKNSVYLFIRMARYTVPSRQEVLRRELDVLVYLDIGMEPSTSVWGASRLAPIQMCVWGHPSTTGLKSMDYYISSDMFHIDQSPHYQSTDKTFLEQLVRLPSSLGIAFDRPTLSLHRQGETLQINDEELIFRTSAFLDGVDETLGFSKAANLTYSPFGAPASISTLVEHKRNGNVLILIPQHLPKFHPNFDEVMRELLETVPNSYVAITYDVKKSMWRKTLETRWSKKSGFSAEMIKKRILWLESLTPQQYLAMLSLGDVMIDPFPFGGGVTTLESLAVCTPVITLPSLQNVPALTAGMLRTMSDGGSESHMRNIFSSIGDFIAGAFRLLTDADANIASRTATCRDADSVFTPISTDDAVDEWAQFLATVSVPNANEASNGTLVDKQTE